MVRKSDRQYELESRVKTLVLSMLLVAFFSSCAISRDSSIEEEFKNYTAIQRGSASSSRASRTDYKVLKGSDKTRPDWISHPQKFASENLEKNAKKGQLYFSYETTPKLNQDIACTIARAFTREDMVDFVIDFFREGETDRPWDKFLQSEIREDLLEFFKSAKLEKTYWEYREYAPQLGQNVTQAYTCALLVSVDESSFSKAINQVQKSVIKYLNYSKPLDIKMVTKVFDPELFLNFYQMNY